MTLRAAIAQADLFAAVILHSFFDTDTLDVLCGTKEPCNKTYSLFGYDIVTSPEYPNLADTWESIRADKSLFKKIAVSINYQKPPKHIQIHRFTHQPDSKLMQKEVVLDPVNPVAFTAKKHHVMHSTASLVIDTPPDRAMEFHLFVLDDKALDNATIKALLVNDNKDDFLDEEWFLGAHVTNLHRIKRVEIWIDNAAQKIKASLSACRPVNREPQ
jgi:hypothetical protein